jgi:hypothetical protein
MEPVKGNLYRLLGHTCVCCGMSIDEVHLRPEQIYLRSMESLEIEQTYNVSSKFSRNRHGDDDWCRFETQSIDDLPLIRFLKKIKSAYNTYYVFEPIGIPDKCIVLDDLSEIIDSNPIEIPLIL